MSPRWLGVLAAVASTGASLLIGAAADRWAPPPAADTLKGTEEAFVEGLQWRELPPRQPPLRWTEPRARVTFRQLPPGPAALDIEVRYHGSPVTVTANGVRVAEIGRGQRGGRYEVGDIRGPTLEVDLQAEAKRDSLGRALGTQLFHVVLHHAPSRRPPPSLLGEFALVGACGSALALAARVGAAGASASGIGLAALLAAALVPHGLIRSAYAPELALMLAALSALACVVARVAGKVAPGSAPWAFAAVLAAGLVQGVAAVSPMMVTSDAYFHANNLLRVSKGELFLTSITPHARAFRIPYGVSFYALLQPFLSTGIQPVVLVRWGAAASGSLASMALLFLLLKRSPRAAGLSVVLLQLLPASFVYYSEGTLSNVFGQSMTVLFFAWWAGAAPLGAALGALLLGVGCLAHLSSLIGLVVLCVFLLALRRGEGHLDPARKWALMAGFAVAAAYYAHFFGLIAGQLPRMLEGGGESGGGSGVAGVLADQLRHIAAGWGLPATLLCWFGRPRGPAHRLDRDLAAFWLSGAALFAVALLSPLEARYVYALTLPVGVAAARGLLALWDAGGTPRLGGAALLLLQAALAARGVVDAVLFRYRP